MQALSAIFYFIGTIFMVFTLASIGHDGYEFYINQEEQPFTFSMLGYFIEAYALEYGKAAVDMVGAENWALYIDPILQQKTILAIGAPAVSLLALGKICAVIKYRQENKWARKMNVSAVNSRDQKGKKFKYNRK